MKHFTEEQVRAEASAMRWPHLTVTLSGRARNVVLVIAESVTLGEAPGGAMHALTEPRYSEHLEYFTLDADVDAEAWAAQAVARFNETLHEDEPSRTLLAVFDVGPSRAHAFIRMPAGGSQGELFKCHGCGLVVSGSPTFDPVGEPYALKPPAERDFAQRRRFFSYCS